MATVLITGGTGLIGSALTTALLAKNYKVIILTRSLGGKKSTSNLSYATWNVKEQTIDEKAIGHADHIVHLAGANIAEKRWTEDRKKEIVESRTMGSTLLVNALSRVSNDVKSVTSASAIGWYGEDRRTNDAGDQRGTVIPFNENDPPDKGFLGSTCKQWEDSIEPVTQLGKRLVKLRNGIVMSNDDGYYKELKKRVKLRVATILGKGDQVVSWMHIDDIVRLYIATIEDDQWEGVYNAVTPIPVTNKELVLTMARTRNKFFIPFHVPEKVLKTVIGEGVIEALKSTTVMPAKVQAAGFVYEYPTIKEAILELEGK
jgi:uncharacterized protein (TIGR01777 family)